MIVLYKKLGFRHFYSMAKSKISNVDKEVVLVKEYGLFINGEWKVTDEKIGVVSKATGSEVALISVAGEAEVRTRWMLLKRHLKQYI